MTARIWLAGAALALVLAPRFAAADYWRYETESGAIAFTDDAKAIPAKYAQSAKRIKAESLFDYDKLSIVDPIQPAAPRPSSASTAVPVFPWPTPERADANEARPHDDRVSLNVGGMQLDLDADSDEPIYIDRRQYTDTEGRYFDHGGITGPTTVIRRGDKPLAYIDERE